MICHVKALALEHDPHRLDQPTYLAATLWADSDRLFVKPLRPLEPNATHFTLVLIAWHNVITSHSLPQKYIIPHFWFSGNFRT